MIHYQFETIHPFLDGNGRIGRLLITLYLMEKGVLTTPALYISYFLKKNRIEYYDRMSEVRRSGNYEQWIKFFLQALYESAEDATITIDKLIALHDKNITAISSMGRAAKTALRLFAYLEENPIIEIQKTATALDTTFKTISDSVRRLCEMGILTQSSGDQRNRTFHILPTLIFCVKEHNFNIISYVEYCVDSKHPPLCNIKIYTIGGFIMFVNFTHIGRRVKEVRNVKGMSQAELAEQIDMSVPYISLIETAAKNGLTT